MLRKNVLTFLWASAANPLLVALLVAIFSKKTKKPVSSSKQSKKNGTHDTSSPLLALV